MSIRKSALLKCEYKNNILHLYSFYGLINPTKYNQIIINIRCILGSFNNFINIMDSRIRPIHAVYTQLYLLNIIYNTG